MAKSKSKQSQKQKPAFNITVGASDAGKLRRAANRPLAANSALTEVADLSETEPVIEDGLNKSLAHAGRLARRWDAKNKAQAKVMWINPLAPVKERKRFATKRACQREIDRDYKHSRMLARRDNQPYTPQKVIVSPKRTLADLMDPRLLAAHQSALQVAGEVQAIGRRAIAQSGVKLSAGNLIAMTESQALARVDELDDTELRNLCMKAGPMGKIRLARKGRAEAQRRGMKVLFV